MPLSPEQRQQLRKGCGLVLPGFAALSAAQEFRAIADWLEAQGLDHDVYGEGPVVQRFEAQVAHKLGKPAAVFMPSGVMAQLSAVKVWAEAARLPRFGMHPTSHLYLHEAQAYAALMLLHGVPLGDPLRPLVANDLAASTQPLACLVIELPIREAGGQLPSWEELLALHTAARERGIRLHMDGARLWESAAFYGRTHAEIAALFDSVYVSVYKGVGGLAGAVLTGDEDFIAQARLWRSRLGGTLVRLSPMAASAAMRFEERLAMMPALYQRTLALAQALQTLAGLRINPQEPHTNMLHLYFDAPAERVMQARDSLAQAHGCWLLDRVRPAPVPGYSCSELYVGDRLLNADNARVLPLFAQLMQLAQQGPPTQQANVA